MDPQQQSAVAPVEQGTEISAPEQSYTWQASEYIFHEKSASWYLLLWVAVAIMCGGLAFFKQWLSIAVVIAMAFAVLIYSRKQPRTLSYTLDQRGISIDGKEQPYNAFRSFSILEEVAWHEIDLEPARRFVPRLTLLCESDDIPVIEEILSNHLPRADRELDWIERLAKYIRF